MYKNIEGTAEYLGVTKDTIRSWKKNTDIPAHKVGDHGSLSFSKQMNG
ncbi:excisionase family DNA-binding protein [Anaerosporobacter sp.]